MNQQESQLILRCQHGDQKAYEQLYKANVGKIYALCLRLCGSKALAEDLTQEAFIRAWQKLDSFRGDSAFSSWLYRLSSNVAVGYLRQQSKWQLVEYSEELHDRETGSDTATHARHDVENILMALPDQARVVLILYEYLGYKHHEIADLLGVPVGTSKSHLHRARGLLKEATK